MRNILRLLGILALILTVACDSIAQAQSDYTTRPIHAVATIGMVGDIVEQVGGDRVDVITLMGPGIDPHLYKASEGDVTDLASADIVFYSGLHLEAQMGEVLEKMQERARTVAVTDEIDRDLLVSPPQFDGNYDPHVWFDVTMWMSAVETVRDALVEMDPGSAALYQKNASAYLLELEELHQYVMEQAARVPEDKRVLLTAHDAFGYFGRAYAFEVHGLQGISTSSEASTADVQRLSEFIVERQIPAMFVESSVPPRTIEALQAAVRSKGFNVEIGGSLYSDAMGDPDTPDGTYIGMVRHNIDTIVNALSTDP